MTASQELLDLVAIASEAVHRAGAIVRTRRPGRVTDKGDRDLRSDVDLAAEQTVRRFLAQETPDIAVLGEEEGGKQAGTGRLWVIDPIDGTVNYIHGVPLCAVSLSLLQDRSPISAATHLPFLDTTYTACTDGGTYLDGHQVRASSTVALRQALVSIDQYTFTGPDPQDANATRLGLIHHLAPRIQRLRILGTSAIDLAWTADGKLDACIIMANNPWDTSAGVLLAREAGAIVVDLQGRPHSFDSRSTLAAAPGLAAKILAVIRETDTQ